MIKTLPLEICFNKFHRFESFGAGRQPATFPLEFGRQAGLVGRMNKPEIAAALRQEVGELEQAIKKLQARCERLKTFVLDLEAEIAAAGGQARTPAPDSKFRKVIDQVFGEKPKRVKR